MSEPSALLPCPFCGNADIDSDGNPVYWVCCQQCGANIENEQDSPITAWNTRAAHAQEPVATKNEPDCQCKAIEIPIQR